jgi:hypothetical protein
LHAKPQLVPSHVGVAFDGTLHGAHDDPQLDGDVLSAHAPPHWW